MQLVSSFRDLHLESEPAELVGYRTIAVAVAGSVCIHAIDSIPVASHQGIMKPTLHASRRCVGGLRSEVSEMTYSAINDGLADVYSVIRCKLPFRVAPHVKVKGHDVTSGSTPRPAQAQWCSHKLHVSPLPGLAQTQTDLGTVRDRRPVAMHSPASAKCPFRIGMAAPSQQLGFHGFPVFAVDLARSSGSVDKGVQALGRPRVAAIQLIDERHRS